MVKIAIVYSSIDGHTTRLAKSVLEGITSVEGVEGTLFTSEEALRREILDDLSDNYTAIIFGTPTLMGSPSAKFKEFMESSSGVYFRKLWKNKIAGAFTVGGSRSGDKLNTLTSLALFAAQHGMVWVPLAISPGWNMSTQKEHEGLNTSGFFLGVGAQANVDQDGTTAPAEWDLKTGYAHGKRLAQIAKTYEPAYESLKEQDI
ncbi:CYFA0S03e00166g1_1 [Cyberlindnera fabianii]|uniref:CYFA0S03e00166g1_1 n=1 Tax=Cyberlindnera fabianii TaxID=36022 RepID=A0A061AUU5_CYBFA|nr:putative NAD(P)H dehydrogenase (quinone) FQR1-like 1 [Cyberlindnera fabianii]CDR39153.1 CYFA0S03e00166g1_1 [Cyberlindnera fabianii]